MEYVGTRPMKELVKHDGHAIEINMFAIHNKPWSIEIYCADCGDMLVEVIDHDLFHELEAKEQPFDSKAASHG